MHKQEARVFCHINCNTIENPAMDQLNHYYVAVDDLHRGIKND
jgi:hypothetical protein